MKTSAPVLCETLARRSAVRESFLDRTFAGKHALYAAGKRLIDLIVSVTGLFLLWPLLLAIAVWVRLDSRGPALYAQTRVGKDGAEFQLIKFRTMTVSAESDLGPAWACVNDPRVTRAGALLRKLYLDELPQLWNILKGDMSFVGPRPERPFFYPMLEKHIPRFSTRCAVKPGLTGLAQICQAHEASLPSVRRKFRYDRLYIRRRSLALDLYVLRETVRLILVELKETLR